MAEIIKVDCYAGELHFIFGQAAPAVRKKPVALPWLRQLFYGYPEDQRVFHDRMVQEMVHELGHSRDLIHCVDPECVL